MNASKDPRPGDHGRRRELAWTALSRGSGIAAAIVTRNVVNALWSRLSGSGHEPPLNPADRRIGWVPALQWGVAAGVGAGVARVVGQRIAATGWEAATGASPPGVRS